MCGSGPEVDDTIQQQQLALAEEARREEEARQQRIREGTAAIDRTFNGGWAGTGAVAADATYDPNQTYYTAAGDVWQPTPPPAATPTGWTPTAGQLAEGLFGGNFSGWGGTKPEAPQHDYGWGAALQQGLYTGREERAGFDDAFYDKFQQQFMDYYQPQLDDQFGDANDQLTFALARSGNLNSTHAADSRADLTSAYDDARAGILSEAAAQTDNLKSSIAGEKSSLIAQLNATGDSARAANEATSRAAQLYQQSPTYNPLGDVFAGITQGYAAAQYGRQQQAAIDRYYGKSGANSYGRSSGRIVGA